MLIETYINNHKSILFLLKISKYLHLNILFPSQDENEPDTTKGEGNRGSWGGGGRGSGGGGGGAIPGLDLVGVRKKGGKKLFGKMSMKMKSTFVPREVCWCCFCCFCFCCCCCCCCCLVMWYF